jgi:hypothetical protein
MRKWSGDILIWTGKEDSINAEVHAGSTLGLTARSWSSHHVSTTGASAGVHCKTITVSGSQQLWKPIHLGKVRATWKDEAQYYEGKR